MNEGPRERTSCQQFVEALDVRVNVVVCDRVLGYIVTLEQGIRLKTVQSERLTQIEVVEDSSTKEFNRKRLAGGARQITALGAEALFDSLRQVDRDVDIHGNPTRSYRQESGVPLLSAHRGANCNEKLKLDGCGVRMLTQQN